MGYIGQVSAGSCLDPDPDKFQHLDYVACAIDHAVQSMVGWRTRLFPVNFPHRNSCPFHSEESYFLMLCGRQRLQTRKYVHSRRQLDQSSTIAVVFSVSDYHVVLAQAGLGAT